MNIGNRPTNLLTTALTLWKVSSGYNYL